MPETRIERALFALGLVAIAALVLLVAHFRHHNHDVTGPPQRRGQPRQRTHPRRRRLDDSHDENLDHDPHETNTPAAALVSLGLTARADTWLEVRSGSPTGPSSTTGRSPQDQHQRFRAAPLWARFGAAGNLSARLGGKPLQLQSGTYSATVDRHGPPAGGVVSPGD